MVRVEERRKLASHEFPSRRTKHVSRASRLSTGPACSHQFLDTFIACFRRRLSPSRILKQHKQTQYIWLESAGEIFANSNETTNTIPNMASNSEHTRRKAVGFEAFAKGKKGVTRAIKEFRVRKEKTTRDKAILLRGYKKVMKQEGLEAGRGANRKRGRDDEKDDDANNNDGGKSDGEQQVQEKKKRKKFDPMAKRLQKLADKRKEKDDLYEAIESKKKEQVQKEKERKQRTQTLKKRTRRGQPIMKDVISGLLNKLENDGK